MRTKLSSPAKAGNQNKIVMARESGPPSLLPHGWFGRAHARAHWVGPVAVTPAPGHDNFGGMRSSACRMCRRAAGTVAAAPCLYSRSCTQRARAERAGRRAGERRARKPALARGIHAPAPGLPRRRESLAMSGELRMHDMDLKDLTLPLHRDLGRIEGRIAAMEGRIGSVEARVLRNESITEEGFRIAEEKGEKRSAAIETKLEIDREGDRAHRYQGSIERGPLDRRQKHAVDDRLGVLRRRHPHRRIRPAAAAAVSCNNYIYGRTPTPAAPTTRARSAIPGQRRANRAALFRIPPRPPRGRGFFYVARRACKCPTSLQGKEICPPTMHSALQ